MTSDKELSYVDKVVTCSVDIQSAHKFKSSKRGRAWLKLHPNFTFNPDTQRWDHIYDEEHRQWVEKLNDEQRGEDVQQPSEEVPEEGGVNSRTDVLSRGTGEDTFG